MESYDLKLYFQSIHNLIKIKYDLNWILTALMQRPGHISFTGTEPQPKYRKWDACARHGGQQSVAPITTEPDPLDLLSSVHHVSLSRYGARFSKVPRTFRARKAIRKTTTCLFCKAGLSICCNGDKNKNNCKVSCLETPSFWRYKENYVTRNTPEKFRDFRETGPWSQQWSLTY